MAFFVDDQKICWPRKPVVALLTVKVGVVPAQKLVGLTDKLKLWVVGGVTQLTTAKLIVLLTPLMVAVFVQLPRCPA